MKTPKDNNPQVDTKMGWGWLRNRYEDTRHNWGLNNYSSRGRNSKRRTIRTFRTGAHR